MRIFLMFIVLAAGGSIWYVKAYKTNWDKTPIVFSTPKGYAAPVALDQGTIENKLKQIESVSEVSVPAPAVAVAAPAISLSRASSKAATIRKGSPTKRLMARAHGRRHSRRGHRHRR